MAGHNETMWRFIVGGEQKGNLPNIVEAYNEKFLKKEDETVEPPASGESAVGEEAVVEADEPIAEKSSDDKVSRKEFEKLLQDAKLISAADPNPETMEKITGLYNKYFEGIETTLVNIKELEDTRKGIETVEIRKPRISPTSDRVESELKIAEEKAKLLKEYNKKLESEEKKKKSEEEKQKENDLRQKIAEIENRINELKDKIRKGGLSEKELKEIDTEINELFELLKNYKKQLLELVDLMKGNIEKEARDTYGVESPEKLREIWREDSEKAGLDTSRSTPGVEDRSSGGISTGRPIVGSERPAVGTYDSHGASGGSTMRFASSTGPVPVVRSEVPLSSAPDKSSRTVPTIRLKPGREDEDEPWQRMRMPPYCDVKKGRYYHAKRVGNELKYVYEEISEKDCSAESLKGLIVELYKKLRNR